MNGNQGKSRTAIFKRNKKKIENHRKLYPKDKLLQLLPHGFLEKVSILFIFSDVNLFY